MGQSQVHRGDGVIATGIVLALLGVWLVSRTVLGGLPDQILKLAKA